MVRLAVSVNLPTPPEPTRNLARKYKLRPLRPLIDRWREKVDYDGPNGCWLWLGYTRGTGYGAIWIFEVQRSAPAHRVSYEMFVGPIPDGLDLDHLCRNRACVNPEHLEPVTRAENLRRGRIARPLSVYCSKGHPLTDDNLMTARPGRRDCLTCHRQRTRDRHRDIVAGRRESKIKTHGLAAYRDGACRCDVCREAIREYDRRRAAKRVAS